MQNKKLRARIDGYIFIKKAYSVWTHLIPFGIAALLLLLLSVPEGDLLRNLAEVLEQPSLRIWLPALLLTLITGYVYLRTISTQIKQAYLWSNRDILRTAVTFFVYLSLCSLMAFLVLRFTPCLEISRGSLWACFLVAVFSLSGIGWRGPSSWVELIGVKSPDYTAGRLAAGNLTKILKKVREEGTTDPEENKQYIKDFLREADNLKSNIEKNLEIEPEWSRYHPEARYHLQNAYDTLNELINQVKNDFPTTDDIKVMDFPLACRFQKAPQYIDFIRLLKELSDYWPEWKYP